jgi:hypothetical protein
VGQKKQALDHKHHPEQVCRRKTLQCTGKPEHQTHPQPEKCQNGSDASGRGPDGAECEQDGDHSEHIGDDLHRPDLLIIGCENCQQLVSSNQIQVPL